MGIATIFVPGKRLTAAQLNLRPYLHAFQTTTQTIANLTPTAITMDGHLVDTIGGHSQTVNNSRYTPSVPGSYRCLGQVAYFPNATGLRTCHFRRNGQIVNFAGPYATEYGSSDTNNAITPQAFATIQCNGTTDYIELFCSHNAGGNLSTYYQPNSTLSFMIIEWVAP